MIFHINFEYAILVPRYTVTLHAKVTYHRLCME